MKNKLNKAKLLQTLGTRPGRSWCTDQEVEAIMTKECSLREEKLLPVSPNKRYGMMKRAFASGEVVRIRRGLYALSHTFENKQINLFELAQHIYGPSYVSFESALSYHQWIPEAVYNTASATSKRKAEFATPLGLFQYYHLPAFNFLCGVILVTENKSSFMVATPLKAICDYVYHFKKNWTGIDPLLHSLRIDEEQLYTLTKKEMETLAEYYHTHRLTKFLQGLAKELNL